MWWSNNPSPQNACEKLSSQRPSLIQSLEPRMMFDGAMVVDAAAAAVDASVTSSADSTEANTDNNQTLADQVNLAVAGQPGERKDVVFVDTRLPDYHQIAAAVSADAEVILIDSQGNGVNQIANALAGRTDIDAIHIVSHGDEGVLLLGNAALHSGNMDAYAVQLSEIVAALKADGDILLYGCDVAAGSTGEAFVAAIAAATGADVGASDNTTGSDIRGGDWDLEIAVGDVAATAVLDIASLQTYDYDLATFAVSTIGELRTALATSAGNGVADTITFLGNISATGTGDMIASATDGQRTFIDINITDGQNLAVVGGGFSVDANYYGRVLEVRAGTVSISDLTLREGLVSGDGGDTGDPAAAAGDALGGAIRNAGTLTLSGVTVPASGAAGGGGGGGNASAGLGGSGGGGGGGGLASTGGGNGGDASGNIGGTGGSGTGGVGGGGVGYLSGGGGSTTGGTGAGGDASYAGGGAGGLANNGTLSIGGGGGGAGYDASGGSGGNAAGAIYNAGTLTILSSTVSNNVGAGGGGGGGGYTGQPGNGGAGGRGVGGIWNAAGATLNLDSTSNSNLATNTGGGGSGGLAPGPGSNGTAGGATTNIYNLGTLDTNFIAPPSITSATYNAATGVLVVTGANMTTGDTIDASTLTLTGEGGATYTLTDSSDVTASSATSFSITLSATDKAALNQIVNKNGTSSTGGTTFNLAAADDWDTNVISGDTSDASNGVTVSNVAVPTITSATYNASTGTLVVTGTGLLSSGGASNDIDASKFTLTGEGGATYTLTDTADVEITSGTSFTLTLSATDKAALNQIVNKNGTSSTSATTYNLAAAEDWAAGADAAVTVADLTGNGMTASNVAIPAITSATYDASTGTLVVAGSGFLSASGAANDIVANKFSIRGEGGTFYTLTDTASVNLIVNKNGGLSTDISSYRFTAAEDWAAGADAALTVADSLNPFTASNVAIPAITSATYDASTGVLTVAGSGFLSRQGATNDIVANKFTLTGEGGATYTLTDTANVEVTSGTAFTLTLSATDRAGVNQLANKNGTSSTGATTYNLAAAEDWAAGADAAVNVVDATGNGVIVSNVAVPSITSATYDASTGTVVVVGTGLLSSSGASNDIDASKFTLTGEGGATYTLTDTADVEITSGTSFTLTLSATDKAALNQIVNKIGTSATNGTTFTLAAEVISTSA